MTDEHRGCGMLTTLDLIRGLGGTIIVVLAVLWLWERLGRRDTH